MTAKRMEFGFSGKVGNVGALWSFKEAKVTLLAIYSYICLKLFSNLVPTNTKKSGCVALVRLALISLILRVISFTKIAKSIVVFNLVDMVYLIFRPSTVDVKPSKPMGFVCFRSDSDNVIPANILMPGYISDFYAICRTINPSKYSGIRTIVQNLTQSFSGKLCRIFSSHDVTLSQIGKKRGRVDSACLASSLYHVKNALLRLEAIEITGA